jgi:L-lysine exporter family protein LysE/ArgO
MTAYTIPLIEGFVLSAGLIVGIGPQNALVLRQGLRRQHLLLMVLLCTAVDGVLIGLGTFGMGAVIQGERITQLMTYAGALVLLVCGGLSFKAAFSSSSQPQATDLLSGRKQLVVALLAVTLLNPSLYLDTLLLIGGSASRYGEDFRIWFALGAIVASLVWFVGLSYGSALLAPWLRQPRVLRGIDLLSGAVLWLMAFRLLTHLG